MKRVDFYIIHTSKIIARLFGLKNMQKREGCGLNFREKRRNFKQNTNLGSQTASRTDPAGINPLPQCMETPAGFEYAQSEGLSRTEERFQPQRSWLKGKIPEKRFHTQKRGESSD
jgi:hypothetical protein